jgi:DNA-binding NarL/FixJ family response regulator
MHNNDSENSPTEQIERYNVLVVVETPLKQAGLVHMLASVAQPHAVQHLEELQQQLETMAWIAVVTDTARASDVLPFAAAREVPVVLIAADPREATLAPIEALACVLVEQDPTLLARLTSTLHVLARGAQRVAWPSQFATKRRRQNIVPASVVRTFADTGLTRRHLDVLWLDYQGLETEAIARALRIEEATVASHWKGIRRTLGGEREEIKEWAGKRLEQLAERAVGGGV